MFANVFALVFALLSSQLVNVAGVPSPAADASADLGGLGIGDIINALGIGLVQNISAIITLESLTDNLIKQVSFVRPLGTANSGTIDNVLLVQGAINSLNIIPLGELDLLDVNVSVRAATIDGFGGIPIPIDGLKQSDVPTT
ncbi:hypothetical protein GGU11DRAFT_744521 [Lentinula aff. detonsa]|nr:hypothetical protein GGU11DRAFT_744521 [Lentinula aff. detonsa]